MLKPHRVPAHVTLHLALFGALMFYTALPFFGMAWHNVVPEHDHWFVGARDAAEEPASSDNICADCRLLPTADTVIHAFSPASALQFFNMLIGLSSCVLLVMPRGLSFRLSPSPLLFKSTPVPPPERPPTAA